MAPTSTKPPRIEAIRPRRLYQQVAEQVARLIREGAFRPGEQLPSEIDLSRQFGVSRPTIREAMIALEAAGLVEVQNGNGTFAREVSTAQSSLLKAGIDPGPGPFEQFEARELIECEVAARAAVRIGPDGIAELEAIVEEMEANYPRDPIADDEGFRFHSKLARASGNSIFATMVEELWRMRAGDMWSTLRARILQPEDRQHAIESRRAMVRALRAQDPEAARAAMRRMLDKARSLYFDDLSR